MGRPGSGCATTRGASAAPAAGPRRRSLPTPGRPATLLRRPPVDDAQDARPGAVLAAAPARRRVVQPVRGARAAPRRRHRLGLRRRRASTTRPSTAILGCRPRRCRSCGADGGRDRYRVDPVGSPAYLQGGGYHEGFDDGLGRGVYRGEDHREAEVWDVSHPVDVVDPPRRLPTAAATRGPSSSPGAPTSTTPTTRASATSSASSPRPVPEPYRHGCGRSSTRRSPVTHRTDSFFRVMSQPSGVRRSRSSYCPPTTHHCSVPSIAATCMAST